MDLRDYYNGSANEKPRNDTSQHGTVDLSDIGPITPIFRAPPENNGSLGLVQCF